MIRTISRTTEFKCDMCECTVRYNMDQHDVIKGWVDLNITNRRGYTFAGVICPVCIKENPAIEKITKLLEPR